MCKIILISIFGSFFFSLLAYSEENKLSLRELELKSGTVVEVKTALKIDENALKIEYSDGKSGILKREELSKREQIRRFGAFPSISESLSKSSAYVPFNSKYEVVKSKIPENFKQEEFIKSFKVRKDGLRADIYSSPFCTMPYRYFIPENVPKGTKVPLVVFLHGIGECGTDNILQLKHEQPLIFVQPWIQEKYPCLFLAPQLTLINSPWIGNWSSNPYGASIQMQTTVDIINKMIKQYPEIDEDRIYVTGLSSGGLGAFEAILKYPGKFAGAATTAAGYDYLIPLVSQKQKVAVWAFYNENEKPALKQQCDEVLKKITEFGGDTRVTSFKLPKDAKTGSHFSWAWSYAEPDLIPWLFSHRRDKDAVLKIDGKEAQPPVPSKGKEGSF